MKALLLSLRLLIAPLALGLTVSALSAAEPAAPKAKHVDATAAAKLLETNKEVVVLDIRTEEEFKDGHIAKAVNIDYLDNSFTDKISKLDKSKTYLVHCASGGRSGKSLSKFSAQGFANIYHLDGGLSAWQTAGKPVTK
jgi:phage shock protein E